MKKLIALLLVAGFLCVTTVGCNDSKPSGGTTKSTSTTPPADTKK